MKLGILLPIGSSFKDLKKSGQDIRFIDYYLKKYNKRFEKVFVFSYELEKATLPQNCQLVSNKYGLNRFLYAFLIPFLNWPIIKEIDVFRVTQLTGAVPAIIIKAIFNKPFIFTYGYDYSSLAKLDSKGVRLPFLSLLEKISIKFSSGIIVTNQTVLRKLGEKYHKTVFHQIPNGVDTRRFRPGKKSLKQKGLTLLYVGRLAKQKNLVNLIQAVALILEYEPKLIFIGQGKMKKNLLSLAKKNKVDLKIIDQIPHNKLAQYYQKSDIFCLPSFQEGQPKVLLEAMACGLACLVGRYPGIEEFKNKEEILVTGFKAKEISQNLEELIKNKDLRRRLCLKSQKKIRKDHNIDLLLKKEIHVLKNV